MLLTAFYIWQIYAYIIWEVLEQKMVTLCVNSCFYWLICYKICKWHCWFLKIFSFLKMSQFLLNVPFSCYPKAMRALSNKLRPLGSSRLFLMQSVFPSLHMKMIQGCFVLNSKSPKLWVILIFLLSCSVARKNYTPSTYPGS
jgi:hypothetical protein